MRKIKLIERIRKKSNADKPKKEKKVYSEEALQARDPHGMRPRDYLYIMLAGLITFAIAYYYYNVDTTKSIMLAFLVMFILWMLLRKFLEAEEGQKQLVGWLITWKDRDGLYNIPAFHNMKLQYGRAIQLAEDVFESIPDSFYMQYYMEKGSQQNFNPLLNWHMKKIQDLQKKGERVIWCDGTEKYRNPLEAMAFREKLKESKGLTGKNLNKTTQWLHQRSNVTVD